MSQRAIAIAIAVLVAATLTLEIIASARDLPHDGTPPAPPTTSQPAP